MQFLVEKNITLINFLEEKFPDTSKRNLRNWLKNSRVAVDNKISRIPSKDLTQKQRVVLLPQKKLLSNKLSILYEDSYIIVIEKPSGLLSVPKETYTPVHALGLLRYYSRSSEIYAIHRLDQDTSGVMIFAKGKKAYGFLKKLFASHKLIREYVGIVEKIPEEKNGYWKSYLKEMPSFDVIETRKDGKLAITYFNFLQPLKNNFSLVKFILHTGKKHQIRVQSKNSGHPILGDKRYGSKNKAKRLYLHAYRLSLKHPYSKKIMDFISPIPEEFQNFGAPVII
jgi:tRNA pseudouridine32 synthase/23S rRNA pseudouridine746 synthase/23S rRNA pseudouridine1911/1915/1917 synthase